MVINILKLLNENSKIVNEKNLKGESERANGN